MRKKLFLLTLLLTGFLSAANAGKVDDDILIVWRQDNKFDAFHLETRPKITYEGSRIIIKSLSLETSYEISFIKNMTFNTRNVPINQIKNANAQGVTFRLRANVVTMEGLTAREEVRVFGIDGQLLETVAADADGTAIISLEARSAGVYVIKADRHQTIKVTRR